ncbi:MAG: type II toxin-antitoxin system RelE family toxin [Nitrospiria bacterium]
MYKFLLKVSPTATRDLDRLQDEVVRTVLDALPALKGNPFPRGKLIKKIKGKRSTFYRLRVDKYRVFYSIEGPNVVILKVISKKDADKFIKNL